MKNIVIPYTALKTEFTWLLSFWIFSNLLNVFAILFYQTQWQELITYQPFILFISITLYLIAALIRLIIYAIKKRRSH
jgi:hypothetical protein